MSNVYNDNDIDIDIMDVDYNCGTSRSTPVFGTSYVYYLFRGRNNQRPLGPTPLK